MIILACVAGSFDSDMDATELINIVLGFLIRLFFIQKYINLQCKSEYIYIYIYITNESSIDMKCYGLKIKVTGLIMSISCNVTIVFR